MINKDTINTYKNQTKSDIMNIETLDYTTNHDSIDVVFEMDNQIKEITLESSELDTIVDKLFPEIYAACTVKEIVSDFSGSEDGYCELQELFSAHIFIQYDLDSDMLTEMVRSHYMSILSEDLMKSINQESKAA